MEQRFTLLLGMLLVYFLALPIVQKAAQYFSAPLVNGVMAALLAAVLLVAIFTTSQLKTVRIVSVALGVAAVVFRIATMISPTPLFEGLTYIFSLTFLGLIAAVTFRHLLTPIRVTTQTISASLCVYLLLVLGWAFAYGLVELLIPGSFSYSQSDSFSMRMADGQALSAVYFSLVTITTLGYGDIVPVMPFAKMLASLEAFAGQMYIAILVARLVALHVSPPPSEKG